LIKYAVFYQKVSFISRSIPSLLCP
jgi:hypothetical protein